jgi:hypothetical protein
MVFTILFVNSLIGKLAVSGTKWEHPPDMTSEKISATFSAFVAQYVNTAVIPAIVHMNLRLFNAKEPTGVEAIIAKGFAGPYYDMNVRISIFSPANPPALPLAQISLTHCLALLHCTGRMALRCRCIDDDGIYHELLLPARLPIVC